MSNLYTNEQNLYDITISTDGQTIDYVDPTEGPKEIPDITGHANSFLQVNSTETNIQWSQIGGDGDFSCNECTFGSGSVSDPSITFKTDTNTGLSNPSADTLSISTNGQERVKVDNNNTTIKNKLIIEQNVGNIEFDGLTEYNEQILFGTNNTLNVSGFNKSVLTCRTGNGNLSIQLLGESYTNKTVTRFRVFKSNTSANSIRIIGSSEPVIFRTPFVSVSNFTSSSSPAFYDIIPNGFFGSFDLVRVLDEGGTPPNPSHEWRVENIEVYTEAGTERKLGPLSINGNVQQNITGGDNGFFEISKNVENWQSNSNVVKDWFANMNPAQDTFNERQSWYDIIYNDVLKLYVAISREAFNVSNRTNTNKIATSPDGYTWTLQSSPTENNIQKRWHSIDYNRQNGIMVAVSTEGAESIMRSTDGINWVDRFEPASFSWDYVTYFEHINTWIGSGTSQAPNTNGQLMWSTDDGLTWSNSFSSFYFGPICYNSKTGFYYTGNGQIFRRTTTPLVVNSWVQTASNVAGTEWIAYSPDLNMVLCGGNSSGNFNQVSYSVDNGATFTTIFITNDFTFNQRKSGIWCPKYKCFIVSCCNASFSLNNYGSSPSGKVFYSFNGIDWIDAGLPTAQFYWKLYYNQARDTLIITSLNNGNTDNKFYLTNPNKLQPTADNLYNGIHQSMDNSGNWTFKKNVVVNGNCTFGDATSDTTVSTGLLRVRNDTSQAIQFGTSGTFLGQNALIGFHVLQAGLTTASIANAGSNFYSNLSIGTTETNRNLIVNGEVEANRYRAGDGTVGTPSYSFTTSSGNDTGMYYQPTGGIDRLNITVNNSNKFTIRQTQSQAERGITTHINDLDQQGNVNIGTSGAGNAKNLDVYGTTLLRGNTDVGQTGAGNTANLKVWGDLEVTGNITGTVPAPSTENLTLTGTTTIAGPINVTGGNLTVGTTETNRDLVINGRVAVFGTSTLLQAVRNTTGLIWSTGEVYTVSSSTPYHLAIDRFTGGVTEPKKLVFPNLGSGFVGFSFTFYGNRDQDDCPVQIENTSGQNMELYAANTYTTITNGTVYNLIGGNATDYGLYHAHYRVEDGNYYWVIRRYGN